MQKGPLGWKKSSALGVAARGGGGGIPPHKAASRQLHNLSSPEQPCWGGAPHPTPHDFMWVSGEEAQPLSGQIS